MFVHQTLNEEFQNFVVKGTVGINGHFTGYNNNDNNNCRSTLLSTCLILSSGRVNQSKIPELEIVGPKGYNYKGKKHGIGQIISKFTAYTVTDMDKNFNQK